MEFLQLFFCLSLTIEQGKQNLEPHPIAPSLPVLTAEQEERLDKIINRFIQYDIGKLPGEAGKQAFEDFRKLGFEATPALFRGLQTSSKLEHSCPVTIIATKLKRILSQSNDPELLDFAKDEITSAMDRSPHGVVLRDLRNTVNIRRNSVTARLPSVPKWLLEMTPATMVESLKNEEGQTKHILMARELARRNTVETLRALALFASSFYAKVRDPSLDLLHKTLAKADDASLSKLLRDEDEILRKEAAQIAGKDKRKALVPDLTVLLKDENEGVRQAAQRALKEITGKEVDLREK